MGCTDAPWSQESSPAPFWCLGKPVSCGVSLSPPSFLYGLEHLPISPMPWKCWQVQRAVCCACKLPLPTLVSLASSFAGSWGRKQIACSTGNSGSERVRKRSIPEKHDEPGLGSYEELDIFFPF